MRAGHSEKKPARAVCVTVALTTTAPMPLAGQPEAAGHRHLGGAVVPGQRAERRLAAVEQT